MFRAALREPTQEGFCLRDPQPKSRGVLNDLVVLSPDEVPADRPREDRLKERIGLRWIGFQTKKLLTVDPWSSPDFVDRKLSSPSHRLSGLEFPRIKVQGVKQVCSICLTKWSYTVGEIGMPQIVERSGYNPVKVLHA